jgi:hypothetical protein
VFNLLLTITENGKKSQKSPFDNPVFQFFGRTSHFFPAFPAFSTHRAAKSAFAI